MLQVKKQLLRANGLANDLVQADRSRIEAAQDFRRLQSEAAHAQQTADGLRAQLQQARALLQASHDELTAGMDRGCWPLEVTSWDTADAVCCAERQQAQTVATTLQQELRGAATEWQAKSEAQHSTLRQQLQAQLVGLQVGSCRGQTAARYSPVQLAQRTRLTDGRCCRISWPSRSMPMQP